MIKRKNFWAILETNVRKQVGEALGDIAGLVIQKVARDLEVVVETTVMAGGRVRTTARINRRGGQDGRDH